MKQSPTIVLTGGGSGGHIIPLLSLARELKKQSPSCQIIYIGHMGDSFDSLNQTTDFDFTTFINGGKFRRYHGESFVSHILDVRTLTLNIRDLFRVMKAIAASLRILAKFKPDVVFSKGGFVAVPVGVAARLKGIPIVTHDSDTLPGLANRIIGRWASINATGMPEDLYSYPKSKVRYVGIPTLQTGQSKPNAKTSIGIRADSKVILVSGGGHGSRTINELIIKASSSLLSSYPNLYIVHVSGASNESEVKELYRSILDTKQRQRLIIKGFIPDLYKYTAVADVVIGRAGATSIAEYAIMAKACIIIPSPFLANGHQLKNAELLAARDAATILDNSVQVDEFIAVTSELLNDAKRREQLANNLKTLAKPKAGSELARLVLEVARQG